MVEERPTRFESDQQIDVGRFGRVAAGDGAEDADVGCAVSFGHRDDLVTTARDLPGVLGSRLTGGGFGGATVTLASAEDALRIADQIRDGYAQQHGHAPATFVCGIADGAIANW